MGFIVEDVRSKFDRRLGIAASISHNINVKLDILVQETYERSMVWHPPAHPQKRVAEGRSAICEHDVERFSQLFRDPSVLPGAR